MSAFLCKYILSDDSKALKENIKNINIDILTKNSSTLECGISNHKENAPYWLALALRKIDCVKVMTERILEDVDWEGENLGYIVLSHLFEYINSSSFEELQSTYERTTESNEWESYADDETITELDEEIEWTNDTDTDVTEKHFDEYLEILDYLIDKGIMKYEKIANSDILCKAAFVRIYERTFVVLLRLIPYYSAPLEIEHNVNGKQTTLAGIAVANASPELLEILLDNNYNLDDYTHTTYNVCWEVWAGMEQSRLSKQTEYKSYETMFNMCIPKEYRTVYSRGCREYIAISLGEFGILEAGYLNKLKNIEYITAARYKDFRTLVCAPNVKRALTTNPEVKAMNEARISTITDAVLALRGINANMEIPLESGMGGTALNFVPLAAYDLLLPECKDTTVEISIPILLKQNKVEEVLRCLVYLDESDSENPFLDFSNLSKVGVDTNLYNRYIIQRDRNRNSGECCLCTNKTNEKLKCGHYSHFECLSKCNNTACPFCREEYKLPEYYEDIKQRRIVAERQKNNNEWIRRYTELEQVYGDNIPPNLLFELSELVHT
jgi:hypothetical protein